MKLCLLVFLICSSITQSGTGDRELRQLGMVDIATMDSTILISLQYATSENLFGEAVYDGITRAWLHPDAARKLVRAQQLLKSRYPHLSLLIYDAARPMSVQRRMWNLVRGTDKTNYVSNPANGGGLHNYGMAVDATIVDIRTGRILPMGTGFDYFGPEAHINNEEQLLRTNHITREEYDNRLLLRSVMREAGFRTILYEWWHFNACTRQEARQSYRLIE